MSRKSDVNKPKKVKNVPPSPMVNEKGEVIPVKISEEIIEPKDNDSGLRSEVSGLLEGFKTAMKEVLQEAIPKSYPRHVHAHDVSDSDSEMPNLTKSESRRKKVPSLPDSGKRHHIPLSDSDKDGNSSHEYIRTKCHKRKLISPLPDSGKRQKLYEPMSDSDRETGHAMVNIDEALSSSPEEGQVGDDWLDDVLDQFQSKQTLGPAIYEKFAKVISQMWKNAMPEDEFKKLAEDIPIPANLKDLKVPRVNPSIWMQTRGISA